MTPETWTDFDRDLVKALTCQVRVLSLDQIQRGWNLPTDVVRQQLARLVSGQLLTTAEWNVVPPPIGATPMFRWQLGDKEPDTWRLSLSARNRWRRRSSRFTIYQATSFAARLFGSTAGRTTRDYERQHDLLLAEVGSQADLAARVTGPGCSTRRDFLCAVRCGIHTTANRLDGGMPLARHPKGCDQ